MRISRFYLYLIKHYLFSIRVLDSGIILVHKVILDQLDYHFEEDYDPTTPAII